MYSSLILYLCSYFLKLLYEDKDATELQIFFQVYKLFKIQLVEKI